MALKSKPATLGGCAGEEGSAVGEAVAGEADREGVVGRTLNFSTLAGRSSSPSLDVRGVPELCLGVVEGGGVT